MFYNKFVFEEVSRWRQLATGMQIHTVHSCTYGIVVASAINGLKADALQLLERKWQIEICVHVAKQMGVPTMSVCTCSLSFIYLKMHLLIFNPVFDQLVR